MATVISAGHGRSAGPVTTHPITVSGVQTGDRLVVISVANGAATGTQAVPTDNQSNTYTARGATTADATFTQWAGVAACLVAGTAPTTVNINSTVAADLGGVVLIVRGSTGYDANATPNEVTADDPTSAAVTPTTGASILFAGITQSSGVSTTDPPAGWTAGPEQEDAANATYSSAWKEVTGTAPVTIQWVTGSSQNYSMVLVAFTSTAVAASGLQTRPLMMKKWPIRLRSPFPSFPFPVNGPPPADVTVVAGAATALGVTPAPAVDVRSINASAIAAGSAPAPAVAVLSVNSSALAVGSTPAPVVSVVRPVTAALALGITPAPTVVIGAADVTVTPSAAIALGSTPAPLVLVTVPTAVSLATGVTPAPVPRLTVVSTAALGLGTTPPAAALVASPVTAALALGSTPAPVVLVRVFPTAALAIGSTPAPTVIIAGNVTVVATAALALGSAPAPTVQVVRAVTAALALGSTPAAVVRVVRVVTAALATGTTPAPTVVSGVFFVVGDVTITDTLLVAVALTETAGAAVTMADTTGTTVSVRDTTVADVTVS